LADIVEKYARKGSRIYVEGRLNTRSYDDRDGNKRYVTEITAENILLLDTKRTDSTSEGDESSHNEQSHASDEIPF
jgi:single-strand DNA-binding protein